MSCEVLYYSSECTQIINVCSPGVEGELWATDSYLNNVLLIDHDLSCEKGRMIRVRLSYSNERRRRTNTVFRSIGIIHIILILIV